MSDKLEKFYVALEDRFRGNADVIRRRQEVYLPLVRRTAQVVKGTGAEVFLDIGCGRGEWLSLLREQGVPCKGVDINAEMIGICKEAGHDAVCLNALIYLRSLPDSCLLGVSAFHVVEHLDLEVSLDLIDEIRRCLVDGGVVFFETPNPENVRVGSHTFYIDPTHTRPIPPSLLSFMFEFGGLLGNEIVRLHPTEDFYSTKPIKQVEGFLLNHFCCAQDYAVVGVKGYIPPYTFPALASVAKRDRKSALSRGAAAIRRMFSG